MHHTQKKMNEKKREEKENKKDGLWIVGGLWHVCQVFDKGDDVTRDCHKSCKTQSGNHVASNSWSLSCQQDLPFVFGNHLIQLSNLIKMHAESNY